MYMPKEEVKEWQTSILLSLLATPRQGYHSVPTRSIFGYIFCGY